MICGANVKYRLASIGGWQLATSARLIQALVSYSVIVTVAGAEIPLHLPQLTCILYQGFRGHSLHINFGDVTALGVWCDSC